MIELYWSQLRPLQNIAGHEDIYPPNCCCKEYHIAQQQAVLRM